MLTFYATNTKSKMHSLTYLLPKTEYVLTLTCSLLLCIRMKSAEIVKIIQHFFFIFAHMWVKINETNTERSTNIMPHNDDFPLYWLFFFCFCKEYKQIYWKMQSTMLPIKCKEFNNLKQKKMWLYIFQFLSLIVMVILTKWANFCSNLVRTCHKPQCARMSI